MSLKGWRTALADGLRAGLGITVHLSVPSVIDPPCAVIDAGDPYLAFSDDDDATYDMHTARWTIWLIVRSPEGNESADELDDLLDRLSGAVRSTVSPEAGGAGPTVERVDAPAPVDIGGTGYMVARAVVSVLRPN